MTTRDSDEKEDEEEEEEDEELLRWKTKAGLLEVELCALRAREREFYLQRELIECLETRVKELEDLEKKKKTTTTTTLANESGERDDEDATSEHLNSPVYDAVASMFGRFTGLGTMTTTTTTEEEEEAKALRIAFVFSLLGLWKKAQCDVLSPKNEEGEKKRQRCL